MNNPLPDPIQLNELFNSEDFQAAISAGENEEARHIFYSKVFPHAKQLSNQKILDESVTMFLLSGAFDRPLMPGMGVNRGEFFEIKLSPISFGDRAVAKLYFDGRITAEFEPDEIFMRPEIKSRVTKVQMRARFLEAGYIPS